MVQGGIGPLGGDPTSEAGIPTRAAGVRALGASIWLAAVYVGVDWFLPKLWTDTLGHALYTARNLRQLADLTGAFGLTALIVMTNDLLWRLAARLRTRNEPSFRPALARSAPMAALLVLLLGATWIYGHERRARILDAIAHPRGKFQAGVIQANIGDFDKIMAERGISGASQKVMDTFFQISDRALNLTPRPDLLIWPETSYPGTFRTPRVAEDLFRDQRIEKFVKERGVPLYFGGYDHLQKKDYNSFFFLSPRQSPGPANGSGTVEGELQVYHKNMLLLFGEFIPGAETFKFIQNAFPQVGNFGRGPGPVMLKLPTGNPLTPTVNAGPLICYEALFPYYVLEAARLGSELILNITNDSWFGNWGEPELHLSLTTFRSIEARLPQLRSTNTGISALILPDGEISAWTPVNEPTVLNVTVPLIEPVWTLMKAWGDWFGRTLLFLAAATWVWALRRRPDPALS